MQARVPTRLSLRQVVGDRRLDRDLCPAACSRVVACRPNRQRCPEAPFASGYEDRRLRSGCLLAPLRDPAASPRLARLRGRSQPATLEPASRSALEPAAPSLAEVESVPRPARLSGPPLPARQRS